MICGSQGYTNSLYYDVSNARPKGSAFITVVSNAKLRSNTLVTVVFESQPETQSE